MTTRQFLNLGASALASGGLRFTPGVFAAPPPSPVVRLAELEIDPARIDDCKAELAQEIETAVRVEPGVVALYAVSLKDRPAHVRIFEVYADEAAYRTHLQSPHFKKYKSATQDMVKSLRLIETNPIALGAKP